MTPPGASGAPGATNAPKDLAETDAASASAAFAVQQVTQDLADTSKLSIYGFADFTYSHLLSDRHNWDNAIQRFPSFYIGNLNVYLDANLSNGFRSLMEIRFTYLPDGASSDFYGTGTENHRTDTTAADYTDYGLALKLGGLSIQRAWIEYAAHPLLTLRFGQWLTPYGIWNVDHGSPVIIGTRRPIIVGLELLPQRQTGIEMYGSYGLGATQLGYELTLSNGRGPTSEYLDLDRNKAIGWRLWARNDSSIGTIALGTSGYRGRYTDLTQVSDISPSDMGGQLVGSFKYPIVQRYDELDLALDLKWNWGGFLLQSEAILKDVAYADAYRAPEAGADSGPPGAAADSRKYGYYVLTGYRTPWFGIMPFIGTEYFYLSRTSFWPDATAIWGGFNVRPTERVVFKLMGTHVWFPTEWTGFKTIAPLDLVDVQIAWSF